MTGRLYIESDAVISDSGCYRYLLRRTWDTKMPRALLVMLNPSTADARTDDPTIRSCVRLLSALHYGSMEVVNLFAWRATDPNDLREAIDPIGDKNDSVIAAATGRCDIVICGWGSSLVADKDNRARDVIDLIRAHRPALFCFGKTKDGSPKHPLFIKSGTPLMAYP